MSDTAGELREHLTDRLLPALDSPDTVGFWAAASRRQLAVRRCRQCRGVIHLPRSFCARCGISDTHWAPVRGDAVVHSWTVVEHQVHPAYPTPYTIALIELIDEPAVRFLTYLPQAVTLEIGQAMTLTFETLPVDDGEKPVALPRWVPA
jgi:uncharacterized protein